MNTGVNQHIESYLDYYFGLETSPDYAVLLRGKWGAGKSWFIKDYIEREGESEFLYVSLNGVTSYKEIEDALFRQLHPFLASKGMKLAGRIVKGLVKTTIKVDLDRDGKEDGSLSSGIPEISLPDFFKGADDKKIIFDDLERCSIEVSNILGYITQFVENNGLKVLILANEDEIIKRDQINGIKDSSKTYITIKEKLIGKSFDVSTDFSSAINEFVKQTKNLEVEALLLKNVVLLKSLFDNAGYNNLRHLKQSILDFDRFYTFLPKSSYSKEKLIEHIIKLFFSISFELRKGTITEDSLKELFLMDYSANSKGDEKSDAQKIKSKYDVFGHYYQPLDYWFWVEYFKIGFLNKEDLTISIENSIYYQEENTQDWVKLWHYYDIEDDAFERTFKHVYERFSSFRIENKYELVQIVGMFINYSELKLIPQDKATILNLAHVNVQKLKEKGKLILNKHEEFPSYANSGLRYQALDSEEFKDFLNYIAKEAKESKIDNYQKVATELLTLLDESVESFREKVLLTNSSKNLYFDIPILSYIDPKLFVDALLKLTNVEKKNVGWILEERYAIKDFNSKLQNELPWLTKVYDLLSVNMKPHVGKISGLIIEDVLLKAIEKSAEALGKPLTKS